MIRSFLFALLFSPVFLSAQNKVGKTKAEVKKELDTWKNSNSSLTPKITEMPLVTTVTFRDPGYGVVKNIYSFNKSKICISEKTVTSSDSARQNYMNLVLEQPAYEWKKINGNQYISKFSSKMMIELPGNSVDHSFTIYKADWTKEVYEMLNKK